MARAANGVEPMAHVEMELFEIRIDDLQKEQVIVLREKGGSRFLPIVIGSSEAKAIQLKITNVPLPRPLTHDLMRDLITSLGATVQRIVVTALEQSTFFARIYLETADGEVVDVDARPSDSIALALRVECPIFVDDSVLEKAA
jgi:bifunctional DNase/RNase